MSTFLISDTEPTTPGTIPYVEKDGAIIRGVTLGLFDFSNPDTWSGAGVIPTNSTFGNLVVGGATASLAGGVNAAPIVTGTLQTDNRLPSDGGWPNYNLPASFNLPATVTRGLAIVWFRVPKTGWPANSLLGVYGCAAGGGTPGVQWANYFAGDASGVASSYAARVMAAGGATGSIATLAAGANLDKLCDGALHQVATQFDIVAGVLTTRLYLDKVLVATGAGVAAAAINTPAAAAVGLFSVNNYGSFAGPTYKVQNARIGRPQIHDLTARPDIAFADILAADWSAAQGFVS